MNTKQKIVIGIAVVLVALSGLFPPFQGEYRGEDEHAKVYMGHWFLFSPPDGDDVYSAIYYEPASMSDRRDCDSRIITSRVGVQMLTIIIISTGLVLILGGGQRQELLVAPAIQLDSEPEQTNPEGSPKIGPVGLGGWLIIPAIGLILAPIKTVAMTSIGLRMLKSVRPELMSDPRVVVMGVIDFVLIVATVVVASYFFEKRRVAVRAMIGLMVAVFFANLIQSILNADLLGAVDSNTFTPALHAFVYAVIWCTYFTHSKRVKNTFVR